MRTFAQEVKPTRQGTSAQSPLFGRTHFKQMAQTQAKEPRADVTNTNSVRFSHDFSQLPIRHRAARTIQPKLPIDQPSDESEQEADRVSEQVMRMPELQSPHMCADGGRRASSHPVQSGRGAGLFQLKRGSGSAPAQTQAPPIVNEVLRSPGQPLDPATRAFFELRFGHDFSQVRVHSDAAAQQSARAMNAQAYTTGHHIVFAVDQFAPATFQGRRLIAHELAHVVQQRAGVTSVQRKINVDDFDGGKFDQMTIRRYLFKIEDGKIEGNNDSDDKARFIVKQWRSGKPLPLLFDRTELEAKIKVTLIREMQSGFTGDDDERAILALLLHSSDQDLEIIFAPGRGIDPKDLDSDFQGPEEDVLRAFYDRKFVGGRKAALRGSRKLLSQQQTPPPIPMEWPWRVLASWNVPFEQWSRNQQKEANREYHEALRRSWQDYPQNPKMTHQWWEDRDANNALFRLLSPYHDAMRDFFERSTYTRVEASVNPFNFGDSVTLTAFVSLPTKRIPTGEVEFIFVNRDHIKMYGPETVKQFVKKVPLKDGKASLTEKMYSNLAVTVKYPDTGDLIGSEGSIRLDLNS